MAIFYSLLALCCALVAASPPEGTAKGVAERGVFSGGMILSSDFHNLYQCPDPRKAGNVLYDGVVNAPGRWFQVVRRTFEFPGAVLNDRPITCIHVIDLIANGHGGYVAISEGGLGEFHLTLKFYSQYGRGMSFRVQIYSA